MSTQTQAKEKKKYQSNADDFIPYACHYDEETVITKNGELLQVIKVTGFNYETIGNGDDMRSLREHIRAAVSESVLTNDIALWFTTIRRKLDISPKGKFKNKFSEDLNKAWVKKNKWDGQFVTELYISVLVEGERLSIGSPKLFFESLNMGLNIKRRKAVLDQQFEKVNEVTNNILKVLGQFGAHKLGVYKEEGIYYSAVSEFFSKILNLREQRVKFVPFEISKTLPTSKSVFQYNTLEILTDAGKRHLGAIMTVKEYHEIPAKYIDEILQMPVQFIITETFDFLYEDEVLKSFEEQKRIYELSKDDYAYEASGLKTILESDTDKDTDYGEHQITITVLEDTVKELNKSVSVVSDAFRKLGVMIVREDMFLEECYWSQMPGNFDFIKRKSFIPTMWAGGYASLYNFPAGRMEKNHWGDAVTVFHTEHLTPYYFNFHEEKEGHTSIIGPNGAGKTVLMNFLIAQSQKFEPNVYYFDYARGAQVFINALGGKYVRTTKDVQLKNASFNPLQLEDTPQNREFLRCWFEYIITYVDNNGVQNELSEDDKIKIKIASDLVFRVAIENRNLGEVIRNVWGAGIQGGTAAKLAVWYGDGEYANYFDSGSDTLNFKENKITGFDLTEVVNKQAVAIPMLSYLLHRIELQLDKKYPSIIVLDEAWKMIDNAAFVGRLEDWLDRMTELNAIVIFASESIDDVTQSAITGKLMSKLTTQIFLPNKDGSDDYKTVFGLSEKEFEVIKSITKTKRKFLLKHDGVSVVALLDLKEFGKFLPILSATEENLKLFESVYNENDPEWLDKYKQGVVNELSA
jgi:type IV secretion system protein VirB4